MYKIAFLVLRRDCEVSFGYGYGIIQYNSIGKVYVI